MTAWTYHETKWRRRRLPCLKLLALTLHTALSQLDQRNTYVGMLVIDYSSSFNTIVPSKLAVKLRDLGLNTALCDWILSFLTADPSQCGEETLHHPS